MAPAIVKIESPWSNQWIEVRVIDSWYTYIHHKKGHGVSVLGYRVTPQGYELLVRDEWTPPHSHYFKLTSLTGSIEEGDTPHFTAIKELKEESGYEAPESSLEYFGFVYPLKSSDYQQHLFAIDLTSLTPGPILGDGTLGEVDATVKWLPPEQAIQVSDPSIACIWARKLASGV